MKRLSRLCLVTAIVAFTAPASAGSRFLDLSTAEGCSGLRLEEVERVLRLELAAAASTWSTDPIGVELQCEDEHVRVAATDPLTKKRLTREVDLSAARTDRERTLALVVSQLFLTSWSELLLPPPEPVVAQAMGAHVDTSAGDGAKESARTALAVPSFAIGLDVVGGPRVRALSDSALVGGSGAIRPTLVFAFAKRLRWFVEVGFEGGGTQRASGDVNYTLPSASAGLAYRLPLSSAIALEVGAFGGAGVLDITGSARGGGIGQSASGVVAEVGGRIGPIVRVLGARVGLELAAGAMLPRAVGRVESGEDVVLSGAWLGANLVVGFGAEGGGR
ncbi:hypothetical protein AKJ09_10470 [Labilithrix luteola]|uniref:Uncharacterized protein n=1 Tax=Labilithrix luteola TaxID=1391654 RepID=A0A0K1QDS9_9BACT|nr:hypothetical protein [Labilithrix luteola]AKV03807.1 hypothetical protein AKJ09_10470 [Labilithrix luteola]